MAAFFSIFLPGFGRAVESGPLDEALRKWETEDLAGVLPWRGEIYDRESGGFFINRPTKDARW